MERSNTPNKLWYVLFAVILIYFLSVFISCGTPKTCKSETVTIEKNIDASSLFDSIVESRLRESFLKICYEKMQSKKDCLVITVDSAGNEKKREEYHSSDVTKNKEKTSVKFDSTAILKAQIDSLKELQVHDFESQESEIQYVEKKLSGWQWFFIVFGVLMMMFVVGKFMLYLYKTLKKP